MGLPCWHVLRQKILDQQMIELPEVDRHWYLWPDSTGHDATEDVLRPIQDPGFVPAGVPMSDDTMRAPVVIFRTTSYRDNRSRLQRFCRSKSLSRGDRRTARGATDLDTA